MHSAFFCYIWCKWVDIIDVASVTEEPEKVQEAQRCFLEGGKGVLGFQISSNKKQYEQSPKKKTTESELQWKRSYNPRGWAVKKNKKQIRLQVGHSPACDVLVPLGLPQFLDLTEDRKHCPPFLSWGNVGSLQRDKTRLGSFVYFL